MNPLLRVFEQVKAPFKKKVPWFRELYLELLMYEGERPFERVIRPWQSKAERAIEALDQYKWINSSTNPYEVEMEDLWRWYALSRVNDYLLLSFQTRPDFYQEPSRHDKNWLNPENTAAHERLIHQPGARIEPDEYLRFFTSLGFTSFAEAPYSPFFHEIVEVVESPGLAEPIVVDHVYWPGLMFGDMLFSRAGVRVRSAPGALDKEIAENSILYFTYWRARRRTKDNSHGWGSNSQWRTNFYRNYRSANGLHYNVDGKYPLNESYFDSLPEHDRELGEDGLSLDERIELLTNRCFVRSRKDDEPYWPFYDKFDEFTTPSII
jgi:hypothetical protein